MTDKIVLSKKEYKERSERVDKWLDKKGGNNMTELGCTHNSSYETDGYIKGLNGIRHLLRCSICHEILDYYPQYNEDIKEKE